MRLTPTRLLLVIMLLKALLGLLYISQQPLWEYHEADFLKVARIILIERRLPIPTDYPDGDMTTRNANQPPLYYGLMLPVVALLDDGQPTPPGFHPPADCAGYNLNLIDRVTTKAYNPPISGAVLAGYALRWLSLGMALAAVWLTYRTGRVLLPGRPGVALAGAAMIAFEPTLVELASEVNNDNLILMLGAAHLLFCARLIRGRGSLAVNIVGLIVVSGLAVLSKLTGWLMLGISLALIAGVLLRSVQVSSRQRQWILMGLALVVIGVIGVMLFNQQQYGSIFGRYQRLEQVIGSTLQNLSPRIVAEMTVATVQDTLTNYQTPLSQLQPRAAFVSVYRHMILVAILAVIWGMIRAWRKRDSMTLSALTLLAVYTLLVAALVIFRSILNNGNPDFVNVLIIISPVRYYAPALPAIALAFATPPLSPPHFVERGFVARLSPLSMQWGGGRGVGFVWLIPLIWLIVSVAWLSIPVSANRLMDESVISPARFAELSDVQRVDAESSPALLGYQVEPRPGKGLIGVTLYLQAREAISTNMMAEIDLIDSTQQTQPCRMMPVRGLYPTPRWRIDEVVIVQTDIPNCLADVESPYSLQLRWLPATSDNRTVTLGQASESLSLGQIEVSELGVAALCPASLGMIEGLQVIKFNSLPTANAGEYYALSVNWLARSIPPEATMRVYEMQHIDSGTVYTCEGAPRQDTYPFSEWSPGETVYFDECLLRLPADAPAGAYEVSVGVKDADGNLLGDGLLDAGSVTVSP